jgi:hypothetical protein
MRASTRDFRGVIAHAREVRWTNAARTEPALEIIAAHWIER